MGRVLGLLGLLFALAIGGYLWMERSRNMPEGAGNPRAAIDTVGVKNDLISLANAERRYFAREGKYASLDELRSAGDTNVQDHRGPLRLYRRSQREQLPHNRYLHRSA